MASQSSAWHVHDVSTFLAAVTLVFITLKLFDVIDWSWWAVFSPLVVPFIPVFVITAYIALVGVATILVALVVTLIGLVYGAIAGIFK